MPLEELTNLQKLWLNRNLIFVLDPLRNLKKLTYLIFINLILIYRVLGLFHNEIRNRSKAIEIFDGLANLIDLSIDGNPVMS